MLQHTEDSIDTTTFIEKPTRICSKCGKEKPLEEFCKDKNRKHGRSYICRRCDHKRQKQYRITWPLSKTGTVIFPDHMTNAQFNRECYSNTKLRAFIKQYAYRHAKNRPEFRQDLEAMAWANVGMCQCGKSIEYYIEVAKRGIYREYKNEWKQKKYELEFLETLTPEQYLMYRTGVMPGDIEITPD